MYSTLYIIIFRQYGACTVHHILYNSGSMVGRAQPQMRPQPKPSDLYDITLTKDMCCMTEDDDPDVYRTKMPCGHVFCKLKIKIKHSVSI